MMLRILFLVLTYMLMLSKVPSRMMHLHQMFVRFGDGEGAPTKDQILECFRNEFGVLN